MMAEQEDATDVAAAAACDSEEHLKPKLTDEGQQEEVKVCTTRPGLSRGYKISRGWI